MAPATRQISDRSCADGQSLHDPLAMDVASTRCPGVTDLDAVLIN